jgi:hypothetical protein
MMDGTTADTKTKERIPEYLVLSSVKIKKLLRKTRRSTGRSADFYVIHALLAAEQPAEFHYGEELTAEQRENFRMLIYDDFPELLRLVDTPPISRQWDHPIETTSSVKRLRLNRLSHAERTDLNRQLKDVAEASLIRPSQSEFR